MAVKSMAIPLPLLLAASMAIGAPPPADMELLEFLGDFETSAGKPVDPMQFSGENKTPKKAETGEKNPLQKSGTKPERKEKGDETTPHR